MTISVLLDLRLTPEADAAYRHGRATDGATQLGTLLTRAPTSSSFEIATDI